MHTKCRIYLDELLHTDKELILPRMQSHYLQKVMRCKLDDHIAIFNERDGQWLAVIIRAERDKVEILLRELTRPPQSEHKLYLAYSPVKQHCTEIVMQATELGVSNIIPILTERTIVRRINHEKLVANIIEAAEQSERLSLPTIHSLLSLKELLETKPFAGNLLFCKERANAINPSLLSGDGHCVLIGPEGGFSNHEIELIESYSYTVPINFGSRIMRAPTAIIAALSYYQTIHGHWQ